MKVETVQHPPKSQRANRIGYIDNSKTWSLVWHSWHPQRAVPEINFKTEIVVWIRNTRYINRIKLAGVQVKDLTANFAVRETYSARPINDELHCVMFVLPRKGIQYLTDGSKSIDVKTLG